MYVCKYVCIYIYIYIYIYIHSMHIQVSSVEIQTPSHGDLIGRNITTSWSIVSLSNIPPSHSPLCAFIPAE